MSEARLALEAIGQLPDGELDLADAALQLARIDAPDADWLAARALLSDLARDAAALAAERRSDETSVRAGALAGLVAGRWRFAGDSETYDDPANANLIRVLERRRGLPVALGIVWLHCARAAGWEAFGVNFPGHFMVALPDAQGLLVLDVWGGGQPMDKQALRTLLRRVEGPKAELRRELLQPMSPRHVLLRLQENIKSRRLQAGEVAGALTAAEDMLRIAPNAAALWGDAAIINERLDHVAAAIRCLERFLALIPEGEAAAKAREAMQRLRARLN